MTYTGTFRGEKSAIRGFSVEMYPARAYFDSPHRICDLLRNRDLHGPGFDHRNRLYTRRFRESSIFWILEAKNRKTLRNVVFCKNGIKMTQKQHIGNARI